MRHLNIIWSIRETYVHPSANYKECIQRMQYYPSGLPWNTNYVANEQPYKYGGKEFVEMHGLDEYDSHARWYYPALARTTTMDPHSEDYYPISPYAWCRNNFVNNVDFDGRKVTYVGQDTAAIQEQIDFYCEDSDIFNEIYVSLENSKQEYIIGFGNTISIEEGSPVNGQFAPNKNGGGRITLKKSGNWSDAIPEETFHAYQYDNFYRGEYTGMLNWEFEAKTAVTLMGMACPLYAGADEFMLSIHANFSMGYNYFLSQQFLTQYHKAAKLYADYNDRYNIGNDFYKQQTKIDPYNLLKLLRALQSK